MGLLWQKQIGFCSLGYLGKNSCPLEGLQLAAVPLKLLGGTLQPFNKKGHLLHAVGANNMVGIKRWVMEVCFYTKRGECTGIGEYQCPKCKEWYCTECREMFLGFAELAGQIVKLPASICPQCHYTTFWVPKLAADGR
jgi:hypothetical protein